MINVFNLFRHGMLFSDFFLWKKAVVFFATVNYRLCLDVIFLSMYVNRNVAKIQVELLLTAKRERDNYFGGR